MAAERANTITTSSQLASALKDVERLKEMNQELKRQMAKEETTHNKAQRDLNDKLSKYEKMFETIDIPPHKLVKEIESLRDDNDLLTVSVAGLSADLEEATGEIESLRSRLESLSVKSKGK